MKATQSAILAGLLAAQLLPPASADAQEGPAMVDIAPCMRLADDAARHACYDALGAAVRRALPEREPSSDPSPSSRAADQEDGEATVGADAGGGKEVPESALGRVNAAPENLEAARAVEAFGRDGRGSARVRANGAGEAELHDRVTGLREREPGRWLITLASGQVWYQTNSKRISMREGMEVRIYPSPLGGSYRLTRADGKGGGFIQVERVE